MLAPNEDGFRLSGLGDASAICGWRKGVGEDASGMAYSRHPPRPQRAKVTERQLGAPSPATFRHVAACRHAQPQPSRTETSWPAKELVQASCRAEASSTYLGPQAGPAAA
jgi:hypothetical protein